MSEAAEAFPGGSPIRKKRAKKKARAKKPRAKKAKKPKKPCKYGPRDADGLCPKKPRANPFAEDEGEDTPILATKVTTKTATGRKQQSTVGKELSKIANKAVQDASKRAVDKAFESAKNPQTRAAIVQAAKDGKAALIGAATKFGPIAVLAVALGAGLYFGTRAIAFKKLKQRYIDDSLKTAKAGPGGKGITAAMEVILRKQYSDYFDSMQRK